MKKFILNTTHNTVKASSQSSSHVEQGFTIIETMLFLAISGALFAALLVGVGTNITQQRYLDSTRSYSGLIQGEYTKALNTVNQNVDDKQCDTSVGGIVSGTRPLWGGSKCVVLGRAIQVIDNGASVQTSSVTALEGIGAANISDVDDITAFTTFYKPILADNFDGQKFEIDWNSHLTTATTSTRTASKAVILMLRSPVTGALRVFVTASRSGTSPDLSDVITTANSSATLVNCIENDNAGLLPKQAVMVNAAVATVSGVSLDGGGNEACQ